MKKQNPTNAPKKIRVNNEIYYHSGIVSGYDKHIRLLVAYIQAFINHHIWSDKVDLPSLQEAKQAWLEANNFNVSVFEEDEEGD